MTISGHSPSLSRALTARSENVASSTARPALPLLALPIRRFLVMLLFAQLLSAARASGLLDWLNLKSGHIDATYAASRLHVDDFVRSPPAPRQPTISDFTNQGVGLANFLGRYACCSLCTLRSILLYTFHASISRNAPDEDRNALHRRAINTLSATGVEQPLPLTPAALDQVHSGTPSMRPTLHPCTTLLTPRTCPLCPTW